MQGVKRAPWCPPPAFRARPGHWKSARGRDSRPRGWGPAERLGKTAGEKVGERRGTNSPGLYREVRVFTGNLQSLSFTTLLGQSPWRVKLPKWLWGKVFFLSCSSAKRLIASRRVSACDKNLPVQGRAGLIDSWGEGKGAKALLEWQLRCAIPGGTPGRCDF